MSKKVNIGFFKKIWLKKRVNGKVILLRQILTICGFKWKCQILLDKNWDLGYGISSNKFTAVRHALKDLQSSNR